MMIVYINIMMIVYINIMMMVCVHYSIQMDVSELSSKQQSLQFLAGHNSLQYSSYTDSLSSDFKLRRPQSTDSVTSFTIEFRDETNSK